MRILIQKEQGWNIKSVSFLFILFKGDLSPKAKSNQDELKNV